MPDFGQIALLSMIVNIVFFMITWWALQAINIEKWLKSGKVMQARVLLILLTIAIGSLVSNFFLDYLLWSQQLPSLF
ncbi:putative integral membrane protein (TIGR02327 family) [Metabacillus crassostreae]|nr:putative integral membrane protein (TIGR02327 family) [Metabacillus crassostreae]